MGTLVSMLTGNKPFRVGLRDETDKKDLLLLDVTNKITPEYTVDVTELPVEEGPDVSDNARVKPVKVSVEGIISETPINLNSQLAGLTGSAGALVGGLLGGFGPTAGALIAGKVGSSVFKQSVDSKDKSGADTKYDNPAQASRQILEDILTSKTLFTLVDRYKIYRNLMMTSLTFPREAGTGGKLVFSFSCTTITIVKGQETQLEKVEKKAAHSAAKPKNNGTQTTTKPDEDKTSNATYLRQLLKKGTGI